MIRRRLEELRGDWSTVRAACEAAVRRVEFGSEEALWVPEPPLPPRGNARPPHHVPEPAPGSWSWDRLAGLDERGRAVLVRRSRGNDDEEPAAVLTFPSESTVDEDGSRTGLGHLLVRYDGSRTETLRFSTSDELSELTWIDHDDAGRPISFTIAREDGVREIACVWDGDRCVEQREGDVVLTAEAELAALIARVNFPAALIEHARWGLAMVEGTPVIPLPDRPPEELAPDEADFEFMDGGTLTVHGRPEDVRAGRWDQLTITPSSAQPRSGRSG